MDMIAAAWEFAGIIGRLAQSHGLAVWGYLALVSAAFLIGEFWRTRSLFATFFGLPVFWFFLLLLVLFGFVAVGIPVYLLVGLRMLWESQANQLFQLTLAVLLLLVPFTGIYAWFRDAFWPGR
ncbi:MAG: hypothetical protein JJU22_06210 [Gammaproteobacteria bacterium]|nr:hypothetical protein [Gammaproteobacteria bacterium]